MNDFVPNEEYWDYVPSLKEFPIKFSFDSSAFRVLNVEL